MTMAHNPTAPVQFIRPSSVVNRGTQTVRLAADLNELRSSIETDYPIGRNNWFVVSQPSQANDTTIGRMTRTYDLGTITNFGKDFSVSGFIMDTTCIDPTCGLQMDSDFQNTVPNQTPYSVPHSLSWYSFQHYDWAPLKAIRVVSVDPAAELTGNQLLLALDDLHEAVREAEEEGYPIPSDIAVGNAERLLRDMYGVLPRRYEVYPTPDGEIAIDAPNGRGSSVILLCDSQGGALCLVNMDRIHRRKYYPSIDSLSDSFVYKSLMDLGRIND